MVATFTLNIGNVLPRDHLSASDYYGTKKFHSKLACVSKIECKIMIARAAANISTPT
jgi:hypothetical protein